MRSKYYLKSVQPERFYFALKFNFMLCSVVKCGIMAKRGVFMYIRVTKSPTSTHSKVYLVEGYRDEQGKSKQRIVKSYGNLEELQAKDPDILDKLRLEAKGMELNEVTVELNLKQKNGTNGPDLNYGYFFLEALYEQLQLPAFLQKSGCPVEEGIRPERNRQTAGFLEDYGSRQQAGDFGESIQLLRTLPDRAELRL